MSTRQLLRRRTARQIGLNVYKTGTAESSGSTTTGLQDNSRRLEADDFFSGAFLRLVSGSPSETDLMITSNSDGLLSLRPALAAAPDSLQYEILPVHADTIHDALSDAFSDLHQRQILTRPHLYKGLVGGSPSYNADWSEWGASDPVGYDGTGGGSATINHNILNIGDQSALLDDYTLSVDEPFQRYFFDMTSQTVTLYGWVWSDTASEARIGINLDGSTTWSSYHTGGSGWELLNVEVSTGSSIDSFAPTFTTSGDVAYFDLWWVEGTSTVFEYPVPLLDSHLITGISQSTELGSAGPPYPQSQQRMLKIAPTISIQTVPEVDREYGILTFTTGRPASGHRCIIQVDAPLTIPTDDTTIINITPTQEYLVAKKAAALILEGLVGRLPSNARDSALSRLALLTEQIEELETGMTTTSRSARLPANFLGV